MTDLGVVSRAWADGSLLCRAVDFDQTETWPETLVPFEVVEERPVEIAFDLRAVLDRAVDGGEGARQKFLSQSVVSVGETVFGDVDGFVVGFEFDERLVDGLGVKFPAEIGEALIWVFVKTVVNDISIVVIESDEVLMIS